MIFTWKCPKCGAKNETEYGNAATCKCGYIQKFNEKTLLFMKIFQKISETPEDKGDEKDV